MSPMMMNLLVLMDITKNEPRPASLVGLCLSLIVGGLLLAYAVTLYFYFEARPLEQTNEVLWSLASPPIPLKLECHSLLGCLVLTTFSGENGLSKTCKESVPIEEQSCSFFPDNSKFVRHVCFSTLLNDGISILFHSASGVDWGFGNDNGVATDSETESAKDGILPMLSPISGGVWSLTYVLTLNGSFPEGQPGSHRQEWFSSLTTPLTATNSLGCELGRNLTGGNLTDWRIAKLQIRPEYFKIIVKKRNTWLMVGGQLGGSAGLLIAVAALLVLVSRAIINTIEVIKNRRPGSMWSSVALPRTADDVLGWGLDPSGTTKLGADEERESALSWFLARDKSLVVRVDRMKEALLSLPHDGPAHPAIEAIQEARSSGVNRRSSVKSAEKFKAAFGEQGGASEATPVLKADQEGVGQC